jgi:hypothetical protein
MEMTDWTIAFYQIEPYYVHLEKEIKVLSEDDFN